MIDPEEITAVLEEILNKGEEPVPLHEPLFEGREREYITDEDLRDIVLAETNDRGILTRPAWTLMSHLPMFRDCPQMDLSVAESLERRIINIPSSARLGAPFCSVEGKGAL